MSPPESIPSSKYNNVELIPWDPDSDTHAQRLYEQRVACTWDQDLIDEWKVKVRDGNKFFYWIVSWVDFDLRLVGRTWADDENVVDTQRCSCGEGWVDSEACCKIPDSKIERNLVWRWNCLTHQTKNRKKKPSSIQQLLSPPLLERQLSHLSSQSATSRSISIQTETRNSHFPNPQYGSNHFISHGRFPTSQAASLQSQHLISSLSSEPCNPAASAVQQCTKSSIWPPARLSTPRPWPSTLRQRSIRQRRNIWPITVRWMGARSRPRISDPTRSGMCDRGTRLLHGMSVGIRGLIRRRASRRWSRACF